MWQRQKKLFNIAGEIMGSKRKVVLPQVTSERALAEDFQRYFTEKISSIRDGLSANSNTAESENAYDFDVPFHGTCFSKFTTATESEIKQLIFSSQSKSCELDPIPTDLLKRCIDPLLPVITTIINKSLETSTVPDSFKEAIVRPLLKKPGLDKEVFKNYRPVSNLPFISKILEKVVAKQLDTHLGTNKLQDNLQSAYRSCHSTETALLRVHHDIVSALDKNHCVALILLDLSAAFDVIDHTILFRRLANSFGITGDALLWFKSYMNNRKQRVAIGSETSDSAVLKYGVPQGSVLGPKIYTMFSKPVGEICRRHNISYHCYADDTQIYFTIKGANHWDDCSKKLEDCISEIRSWMKRNMLKLNEDKTEFIVFSPKHRPVSHLDLKLTVGYDTITAVSTVKNLGVIFDCAMSLENQVNAITKSCYYHLRNIGAIRECLTKDACKTLINALVTSRLDYGNALLYGVNDSLCKRLQKIQNSAARLISRSKKHDHITPVLKDLHWLPVESRPKFKILLFTFKALQELAPAYIQELITVYQPSRCLRSESNFTLTVPRVRSTTYGTRCFTKSAAMLWNDLPMHLKKSSSVSVFKKNLKTYLFRLAFC